MTLHIGTRNTTPQIGFTLPDDAVTQTFGILAKKGAGKSYAASVMAEEMLHAGYRIVAIDPTGAWWGLRASATGKSEGYPVVIFGGDHADVPLLDTAGHVLGELAATPGGPSMIIDVSTLRKGARRRFATDFFERLYEENRTAVHLFIDEADEFAPQRVQADEARMVGAIEDIVRRGRKKGLGVTLITQRSAVINWDVLSQIDTLLALRTTAPLDVKRMAEWVQYHADQPTARQAVADLASLPIGEAWIWSPGWLGGLWRVRIRKRQTFDSGATPKPGETIEPPKRMAKIDLDAIRARIEATVAEHEANDPKRLRARIAQLEREMVERPPAERVVERVPVPVLDDEDRDLLVRAAATAREASLTFAAAADSMAARLARVAGPDAPRATPKPGLASQAAPVASARVRPAPAATRAELPPPNGEATLSKVERAILTVLAQFPEGRTAQQAGIIAGYSATAGGFRNGLGRLRSSGLIEGPNAHLRITDAGRVAIGPVEPAPSGLDLLQMWLQHPALGKAERAILGTLANEQRVMSAAEVGETTGYSATAGGFRNALGKLRTLRLIEGPNAGMRASADLI